ncbi:glycoside hydrolase family 5 protein [Paenarthrobacter sp. A20]|uniref:glycoside hydrolase family 5 protein n=1 Tax=Paenarthrobacter sp. A20 TaxID=2817891 RepID=UPI00209DCF16|nr:glycoside hydrolase family 5 protein [Paenarthrobacter sp. A20]MCP1415221.1 hypothetical protein [Paenarthrobacter sp. A20]
MRHLLPTLLLSIVLTTVIAGCSVEPDHAAEPMTFGVLGSTCTPERLAALHEAGVSVVELPVAWDRYQPEAGQENRDYVDEVRARLNDCRQAGMGVILSPGLHYPPDWVGDLTGGVLKGSGGDVPKDAGAELVFSAEVRDAARKYLARVASDLGFEGITAIRVGTNATGELGYPGHGDGDGGSEDGGNEDGGSDEEFWAFGDAPQFGIGLAEGVAPSPMPGWVPGSRSWHGKSVTDEQVQRWWDWYAGSVVNAVAWQVGELRTLGFQGRVHVPVAGRGVLPADKAEAVKGRLDGRANPDGAQERGLDYAAQFAVLATLTGVDVDFTGLDDVSDVRARAAVPPQDQCRPGDDDVVLLGDVSSWSSHRYTSALARRAGLGLVGENPGPPDSPFTGGSPESHSLAEQMGTAPRYAVECGMAMFLFGFEENLFEDDDRAGSGFALEDYKEVIEGIHR